jgi:hypothetical protein
MTAKRRMSRVPSGCHTWTRYRFRRPLSKVCLVKIDSNLKNIVIDPQAVEKLKQIQAWEKPRWFGIRNDLFAKPPGKSVKW